MQKPKTGSSFQESCLHCFCSDKPSNCQTMFQNKREALGKYQKKCCILLLQPWLYEQKREDSYWSCEWGIFCSKRILKENILHASVHCQIEEIFNCDEKQKKIRNQHNARDVKKCTSERCFKHQNPNKNLIECFNLFSTIFSYSKSASKSSCRLRYHLLFHFLSLKELTSS